MSMMEQVTPNVFTTTKLRGCNPSFVVTSDGVVVIDTPQLPTKAVAMRAGGRVARPDPLPDQHREPRRPHLRQLLVPRRRRDRQPQGAVGHLHGPEGGARPVRLRARSDPDRRPRGRCAASRPRRLLRRPAARHRRVHRRPDAEGRRPHDPLPVDARPHARPARRPRPRGARRLHRRHDLLGLPDLADDVERRPVDRGARADPRAPRRRSRRARPRPRRDARLRRHAARGAARLEGAPSPTPSRRAGPARRRSRGSASTTSSARSTSGRRT